MSQRHTAQLTRVEELAVSAGADLVNHGGLQGGEQTLINGCAATCIVIVPAGSRHAHQAWSPAAAYLQIEEHAAGHVLAGASLREEGVEGVVAAADGLVRGHLPVRLDAMLQAVQLPAGVADLDACSKGAATVR